eukprot:TRINITY_DN3028_c0_g1_i1.p1 TRINITY_DN3028_c0_g1~~TRINITY_DN3028_c0_g1_i1.p1  ORF type:complete len:324 (-),score=62.43 TRINITY_DN3028_c0_g1_i1:33-947(-)
MMIPSAAIATSSIGPLRQQLIRKVCLISSASRRFAPFSSATDLLNNLSQLKETPHPNSSPVDAAGGGADATATASKSSLSSLAALSSKQHALYQRSQLPTNLGWRDKHVMNLLKANYPVLGNHIITNASDPQRLCINIRSPLSTFIRFSSVHQSAKSLTIVTYENPITKKLQLGLRWWFYNWSEELSDVGNYVPNTTSPASGEASAESSSSSSLSPFASPILLASLQCANIARAIIEGKSKVQTFVWKDPKTQQHMVRPVLVNSKTASVPTNVSDYAVVYTLSWTGKDSWNTETNSPLFRQIRH